MKARLVAMVVLDTMWGDRNGRAPRWFTINPNNTSGKRLYDILDFQPFKVTNICRELVTSASAHGKPDKEWTKENLLRRAPGGYTKNNAIIVVAGARAKKVVENFDDELIDAGYVVLYMPHPAARCWTKEIVSELSAYVEKLRMKIAGSYYVEVFYRAGKYRIITEL